MFADYCQFFAKMESWQGVCYLYATISMVKPFLVTFF